MCHHELSPTSFSFLNSSWSFTGGNHYRKITIAIIRFVLQNFTIPDYLPYILFFCYLFSLCLQVGLLLLSCVCFLIFFFLKLIVNCILLCVVYVREDKGKIMIPMYRLWLHSLYGLYGPRFPLSLKRLLNLITHLIVHLCYKIHNMTLSYNGMIFS